MNQSYIGIILDIIDYYPKDFDYGTYSFIFLSEEHNFEREISFMNANQICQKIPMSHKREIKYSIKVLNEDHLIGITEFIIPNQILFRKEKIFDKICPINMSESTKKVLFKDSNNNISLKIGIHATLQYLEENKTIHNINNKKEKTEYKQIFNKKKINDKKERLKIFSPASKTEKNFPIRTSSSKAYKNNCNIKTQNPQNKNDNTLIIHHHKADSFILDKKIKNPKIKNHKRTNSSHKQENDMVKLKQMQNKILEKKDSKNINSEIIRETSDINITNYNIEKDENNEIDIDKLKNDLDNYINDNHNKINEINNLEDMIKFTNNNIQNILDFQIKKFDLIKAKINKINNSNTQFIKVNEKLKNNISRKNQLIEKIEDFETKKEILYSKEKAAQLINEELFDLKNNEINLENEIFSNMIMKRNYNQKFTNKNDQFLLLFKVLKIISKKYGPLQNLLTQTNSIESQRIVLKNIIDKYNSEFELNNLKI